ncbi:MAG: glycosyltransferase [Gammaproteobacteria bacterium]|nr:glycosyltransferase [Gammaproteobacteria bacterium]
MRGAISPAGQSFAVGGRVKLLELAVAYPDTEADFNILYLVSSALPPFAGELARWAREQGVRVVVNQNGVAYPAWTGARYGAINRPLAEVLDQSDYIVFQSRFCRLGAQRYLHCPDAPFEILYNPVDTSIFQPARRRPSSVWRLLAAGTSHARYRVRSVLEAVAELKRRGRAVQLTIAGAMTWRGAEADFTDDVAASGLESDVTWRGEFSRDEAPALYQQADILIHTSTTIHRPPFRSRRWLVVCRSSRRVREACRSS